MDLLNLGLAFVEGLALIASPCILPILPIVLSMGIDSGKARPFGLILGFIFSFWAFTLFSRQLIGFFHVEPDVIRNISYAFLLLLGILMLSEKLSEKFSGFTQALANMGQSVTQGLNRRGGFWSGILVGLLIGLIWSPCVGPIIAVVLVQSIRQETNFNSALLLASFSLGVGLPMLLITLGGKAVLSKLDFLKTKTSLIRKGLGGIIIATVLLTAGNELFKLPSTSLAANKGSSASHLIHALPQAYPAPNFAGISDWINTKPLTMSALKGKVVLVDFWTYSCINCVRTLPYITAWDREYRDKGLVIVGVHSPEFDFEKNVSNVQAAVTQHGIHYPIALDNQLDTFTTFRNQYWPAHYLIDRNGNVVYTHFGEGEYDVTENNIRALLGVNGGNKSAVKTQDLPFSENQTPETYLGYARAESFNSLQAVQQDRDANYTFPANLPMNAWALNGRWKIGSEKITTSNTGASLRIHFRAKKVFLVLGTTHDKPVTLNILLNGKTVSPRSSGHDVKNAELTVSRHSLYELINQERVKSGVLEIQAKQAGLSGYAFTFGS
jgi:cytochrome c biogenesis protein CcdA